MCRGAKNGICRFISRAWSMDRMFLCYRSPHFAWARHRKHGSLIAGGLAPLFNLEVCDIHFIPSPTQLQMAYAKCCLSGRREKPGTRVPSCWCWNSKNRSLPLPVTHVATFEDLSMSEKHFAYNRTSSVVWFQFCKTYHPFPQHLLSFSFSSVYPDLLL